MLFSDMFTIGENGHVKPSAEAVVAEIEELEDREEKYFQHLLFKLLFFICY